MSDLFFVLTGIVILVLPILLVILLLRALLKKPIRKIGLVVLICLCSIIPMAVLGVLTDSATWCEHEYEVIENVLPTCTTEGTIIKWCPLCDNKTYEYPPMLPHSWSDEVIVPATCTEMGKIIQKCSQCGEENISYLDKKDHAWEVDNTVNANCTAGGYTIEKCKLCSTAQKTNSTAALGHNMVVVSRVEPTYETEGKCETRCSMCEYVEIESLAKLEYVTIEFDDLKLTFGQYSFAEVEYKYSEHHKKQVVKIPVTVENVSKSPNSLNIFYYTLFGSNGIESADVGYYFADDICKGGELLSGKSYTKYFHIVYDGDGVYTIVFDNLLYEKKTVEIIVKNN